MERKARGRCAFRQRDVTAAVRAVKAAGCEVGRVEIEGGKIIVIAGKPDGPADELDTELQEFEAQNGQG
jgi:hypothetical protein